jgi:hypothetical protein
MYGNYGKCMINVWAIYGKYKYDNYDIVTNLWQYRVIPSSSGMKSMVTVSKGWVIPAI